MLGGALADAVERDRLRPAPRTVARRRLGPRRPRAAPPPLRDVREHVLARDAAVAAGAGDLRRIERVLGEQPAHDRRQFLAGRVATRTARARVVGRCFRSRDPAAAGAVVGAAVETVALPEAWRGGGAEPRG